MAILLNNAVMQSDSSSEKQKSVATTGTGGAQTAVAADRQRVSFVRRGGWVKPLVFTLALLPFISLLWSVLTHNAGANPIETIEHVTGEWSLRFLLLSLAMTPAAELFKSAWPVRLRRMIGLFAFFYVLLHFLAYAILDQYLNLSDILSDVFERPYITVGFIAFLILLPLAVTSNRFMVRKLKSRWKVLHRWVYVAAVAGVLHYIWLAKGERMEPNVYLLLLIILLAYRVRKIL